MFGPDVMVTPITKMGCRKVKVYLPAGSKWTNGWTGEELDGGQWVEVDAPIEQIPVFTRNGYILPIHN